MHRILPLAVALLPCVAAADDGDTPASVLQLRQDAPPAEPAPGDVPGSTQERTTQYELNLRGRMLSVPDSILDIWFFNDDEPGYDAVTGKARPSIRAYSLGLEFALVGESGANGMFYFDYAGSTMEDGYWDDKEEPPNHLDGNYLQPTKNLGLVALGADYMHEVHFVRLDDTNGQFGLSALFGGGLGVTAILGHVDEWTPEGGTPASIRRQLHPDDPDDTVDIPRVLPMIDIQASLRFNFGDRLVLRLDGGLHDMLFYGGALGVRF